MSLDQSPKGRWTHQGGALQHSVFGKMLMADSKTESVAFMHPTMKEANGEPVVTTISMEMIEEMAWALQRVGVVARESAERMRVFAEETMLGLGPGPVDWPEEVSETDEREAAVELLAQSVRDADDPLAEAGRLLTAATNAITRAVKEAEQT